MALIFLDVWSNTFLPAVACRHSVIPVGQFGQPQNVTFLDPDADA